MVSIKNIIDRCSDNFLDNDDCIYIYNESETEIVAFSKIEFMESDIVLKYMVYPCKSFYIEYTIDHKNFIFITYLQ